MENAIRIKIGDVEFEAKGDAEIIERERTSFFESVLPLLTEKKHLHNSHLKDDEAKPILNDQLPKDKESSSTATPRKQKKGKSFTPQLVKELNLRGNADVKSFKDFYDEKMPKSNIQITAIAVYYLSKILKYEKIDVNAIYTCYKELPGKVPENIIQNLRDSSGSRYGYIDYKDDLCTLTVRGENLVEKDLPEPKK